MRCFATPSPLTPVALPPEHEAYDPRAFRLKGSGALDDGAFIRIMAEKRNGGNARRCWADEVFGDGNDLARSRHLGHGATSSSTFALDRAFGLAGQSIRELD